MRDKYAGYEVERKTEEFAVNLVMPIMDPMANLGGIYGGFNVPTIVNKPSFSDT